MNPFAHHEIFNTLERSTVKAFGFIESVDHTRLLTHTSLTVLSEALMSLQVRYGNARKIIKLVMFNNAAVIRNRRSYVKGVIRDLCC